MPHVEVIIMTIPIPRPWQPEPPAEAPDVVPDVVPPTPGEPHPPSTIPTLPWTEPRPTETPLVSEPETPA
jgi:hypothetical protein